MEKEKTSEFMQDEDEDIADVFIAPFKKRERCGPCDTPKITTVVAENENPIRSKATMAKLKLALRKAEKLLGNRHEVTLSIASDFANISNASEPFSFCEARRKTQFRRMLTNNLVQVQAAFEATQQHMPITSTSNTTEDILLDKMEVLKDYKALSRTIIAGEPHSEAALEDVAIHIRKSLLLLEGDVEISEQNLTSNILQTRLVLAQLLLKLEDSNQAGCKNSMKNVSPAVSTEKGFFSFHMAHRVHSNFSIDLRAAAVALPLFLSCLLIKFCSSIYYEENDLREKTKIRQHSQWREIFVATAWAVSVWCWVYR